jgi:5-oxoprolinase (ATP-hydrolysing)
MPEVIFHPLAGVLSAYGIGLADLSHHVSREAGPAPLSQHLLNELEPAFEELEREARNVVAERAGSSSIDCVRRVDLRYAGSETTLTLSIGNAVDLALRFQTAHAQSFGHTRSSAAIELAALRVEARVPSTLERVSPPPLDAGPLPTAVRHTTLRHCGHCYRNVPVFDREMLRESAVIPGPALIAEAVATIVIDPGFSVECRGDGILVARPDAQPIVNDSTALHAELRDTAPDPVTLEVMSNAFMSIAEQMGHTLQRTEISPRATSSSRTIQLVAVRICRISPWFFPCTTHPGACAFSALRAAIIPISAASRRARCPLSRAASRKKDACSARCE